MVKRSFKTMFPRGCGMFTAREIVALPHNGYNGAMIKRRGQLFITIEEAAAQMECCEATARKRLNTVDSMVMGDSTAAFQKVYYLRKESEKIIKSFLKKKKVKKNDKT